ncbi:cystinosin homolog isoform X2 [Bacillus rossius redtenbacheri]|uniref:cystinosin homolog isoform X2 n=1 Tax=Bacillus rossius redtenbacheri TaxID=93214 RepID=UPI002FDCAF3F
MFLRTFSTTVLLIIACSRANGSLKFTQQDITVVVHESTKVNLTFSDPPAVNLTVVLGVNHKDLLCINPSELSVAAGDGPGQWEITVYGQGAGHAVITTNTSLAGGNDSGSVPSEFDTFVRVTGLYSQPIALVSTIVGWLYFVAWSVSFYPQIYENWRRKSVVGLNFDFLALNLLGFVLYSLFNCGLYWIKVVEDEYFRRYPRGLNPVQVNDIFFSVHAAFATLITIIQCFIFERAVQTVSKTARTILAVFAVFLIISLSVAAASLITWLDFLYYCSYVKLAITLIKYVPQAWMNFRRKSTVGWSIGNIFLDFTGGMLSMLQMILNAYNYNDWDSIFGDPTKFGLGLFSVMFDIFFMVQHYILYRNVVGYEPLHGYDSVAIPQEVEDT